MSKENLKLNIDENNSIVKMFNISPRKTIKFVRDEGLMTSSQDIADFLINTKGLDPHKIGNLLGEHDDSSVETLNAYANSFPMINVPLDIALRLFLGRFWIPGEAQKIDRVLGAFSNAYYNQNIMNSKYKDADTVHILSFSAVLLNTDAHNPNILKRRRMTKEDFIRNHRGLDKGEDIPIEVLNGIYETFRRSPLGLFETKPKLPLDGELDICFGKGQIGLQLETGLDGISVVVKNYKEQGNSEWSDKKQDIRDWVVTAISNNSVIEIGFDLTMWMLKLAQRPVNVRFCKPDVYYKRLQYNRIK